MKKSKLALIGFWDAAGVLAYVSIVALLLDNGQRIFGKADNILGAILFLMLFVFSALVTSSLVFGRPIYLWLDGMKKEAITLFAYTAGWLFVILISVAGALISIR